MTMMGRARSGSPALPRATRDAGRPASCLRERSGLMISRRALLGSALARPERAPRRRTTGRAEARLMALSKQAGRPVRSRRAWLSPPTRLTVEARARARRDPGVDLQDPELADALEPRRQTRRKLPLGRRHGSIPSGNARPTCAARLPFSVVPVYRSRAPRGAVRMQNIRRLRSDYGNHETAVDRSLARWQLRTSSPGRATGLSKGLARPFRFGDATTAP